MNISIATHLSPSSLGHLLDEGLSGGKHFRETILAPALKKASKENPVVIDINNVSGYSSSFLNEAFGGLVRKDNYTIEELQEILHIQADQVYGIYKDIILSHINDALATH